MLTIRSTGSIANLVQSMREVHGSIANQAAATALTRIADKLAYKTLPDEMKRTLDRPTPYALRGFFVEPAVKSDLVATVGVKNAYWTGGGATPAENFLFPNVQGGARKRKRYETLLNQKGLLPNGWLTTPGEGANLDAWGNIGRGQLTQILSQTRSFFQSGSDHNMTSGRSAINAQKRAGGRFFAVLPGKGKQPGIYQREFYGRNVTPVLIFIRTAAYKPRLDFERVARESAERDFPRYFKQAMADELAGR